MKFSTMSSSRSCASMPSSRTSASTLALVALVVPLPLGEVLPLAGDRAVAGAVAVADDQEGVVVEGMGDDVLVHVVAQVAVEAGADVLVDGLQLDEDQRQAVDEADEVGAAVVVRRAQAGDLQLAHGEEAVCAGLVVEIDHPGAGVAAIAGGVAVGDRHAVADERARTPDCAAPASG